MPKPTTYAAIKARLVIQLSYRYDRALVKRWQRIDGRIKQLQAQGVSK